MNIQSALNLDELRRIARLRLPRMVFDFVDGGADDERGLRRNREAFEGWTLVPRYGIDVNGRTQDVELLGRRWASPFGIAPTGLAGLVHPEADSMLAQSARDRNVPYLMSSASSHSIEAAARIAPEQTWFQLYCNRDPAIDDDMMRRARDAGVGTLVVTIDVPVNANRERNLRNGFRRPYRVTPHVALDGLTHPGWLWRFLRSGGLPLMQNWVPYVPPGSSADNVAALFGSQTPAGGTAWSRLARVRAGWQGALVVKGVMHPEDARLAVRHGADALIVSNHGARQLDAAPSPLDMLPEICEAVPGTPVTIDSGLRRGSDIVIAMALGARFTFFGRPTLYGAAAAGREGILRALDIMRNEVDLVMAQIGCTRLDALNRGCLRRA